MQEDAEVARGHWRHDQGIRGPPPDTIHSAGMTLERLYACEHGRGFVGTYAGVAEHEKKCGNRYVALRNLATNADNKVAIAAKGGVEAVVKAMQARELGGRPGGGVQGASGPRGQ